MEIPDNLFPGLKYHTGPVIIFLIKGSPKRGFALRKDEYVTSVRAEEEMRKKAGLSALDGGCI